MLNESFDHFSGEGAFGMHRRRSDQNEKGNETISADVYFKRDFDFGTFISGIFPAVLQPRHRKAGQRQRGTVCPDL